MVGSSIWPFPYTITASYWHSPSLGSLALNMSCKAPESTSILILAILSSFPTSAVSQHPYPHSYPDYWQVWSSILPRSSCFRFCQNFIHHSFTNYYRFIQASSTHNPASPAFNPSQVFTVIPVAWWDNQVQFITFSRASSFNPQPRYPNYSVDQIRLRGQMPNLVHFSTRMGG